jgi:hypothetical protein
MTQHPTAPLNAYDDADFGEPLRFRGSLTDQAAESSDGSWEDEDDHPINADRRRPSSPASASATSTRQNPKRKRRRAYLATNRRNDYTEASVPTSPSTKLPHFKKARFTFPSADALFDGAKDISMFTVQYVWDISSRVLHHSRSMVGYLLALWVIAFITIRISSTLWGAVSPVCYLPLISSSNLCESWRNALPEKNAPGKKTPQWADYPKMVDLQSKTFQQLMDESIGGSALSLEVKKAEMAITDLVSFVQLSKLKAKDTLASSLLQFVLDAKKTGRGLQKLSSKIGGTVDR